MSISLVALTPANTVWNDPTTQYQPPTPLSAGITTSAGSLLVCYCGLDVSTNATSAPVPTLSVTDSAGNFWQPVTLSPTSQPGARAMVWVCYNALPVTWVSVTPTTYCTADMAIVAEFTGLPANYLPTVDFVATPVTTAGTTVAVTGTASQSDYVFGLCAVSDAGVVVTPPSGGTWAVVKDQSTGTSFANQLQLNAVWNSNVPAGSITATWTLGSAHPAAAVLIGLSQTGTAPALPNPNFPATRVELAFGSTPSDPTNTVGVYTPGTFSPGNPLVNGWTDVTTRCIGKQDSAVIDGTRGRTYELSTPEAGTCTIGLRNDDGAFNPANTTGPYGANVKLGTPVRVTALWAGRYYPLFVGYVSKWPQDWPDMPQYGLAAMQCVDIVSIAATLNLPSAVQGEILADAPYTCLPFNEQYTSATQAPGGQVGTVRTVSECDGLQAVNTSRTNQKTGVYQDGQQSTGANAGTLTGTFTPAPVATGQTLSLLGTSESGMGCTSISGGPQGLLRGPGVTYIDNAGPTLAGNGLTYEFFVNVPIWTANAYSLNRINLFTIPSLPTPRNTTGTGNRPIETVYINNAAGTFTMNWIPGPTNIGVTPGNTMHIVGLLTSSGTTIYMNGNLIGGGTFSSTGITDQPLAYLFGPVRGPSSLGNNTPGTPEAGNYAMQYGTIYPYQLPIARILAHYQAGLGGFQNDAPVQRFARYCAWSGVNLNPAAWPVGTTYQTTLGAAYSTANSAMSDAMNELCLSDGGMWYGNCAGSLMFASKRALYNRTPSIVFGDLNNNSEVPYEPTFGLDYDNAYLSNVTQATQVSGPNTLVAPIEKDTTSVAQYFQRGTLQQSVSSTSPQDAYDRAYWSLNKFRQPSIRLRALTVSAAKKPTLAGGTNDVIAKCLGTDIGAIATVNRRPIGGVSYSLPVIIQKVDFKIGPGVFDFSYVGTPYTPEGSVLVADAAGFDVLGNNVLAW